MLKLISLSLILIATVSMSLSAQEKSLGIKSFANAQKSNISESVFYKAGAGVVLIEKNGYSFTNELSLPFIKGIEIAPSVTFASTLPAGYSYALYNNYGSQPNIAIGKPAGFFEDVSYSQVYSLCSFDLNIYFKPLDFLHTRMKEHHIIKIGGGGGYRHFTLLGMETTNGRDELLWMSQRIDAGIGYNAGIQYNYIIQDKWLIGADFMIYGSLPVSTFRLLVGVKL